MTTFFVYLEYKTSIVIFIILLYHLIKIYVDNIIFDHNDEDKLFINKLNKLYIKNIYSDVILLCLYLFFTMVIFLLFRITLLNQEIVIYAVGDIINYKNIIINVTIFFMIIIYYFKIVTLLWYPSVIRIHFYLFQYKWYSNINEFIRDNEYWLTERYGNILTIFYKILMKPEEYRNLILNKFKSLTELQEEIIYKINIYVHKYKYICLLFKMLQLLLREVTIVDSRFVHYLAHTSFVIILIYDCFQGKMYYTFYAGLGLFLTINIRKCRRFYTVKDLLLDDKIAMYLYSKELSTFDIRELFILNYMPDVKNYLANDLFTEMEMALIDDAQFMLNKYKRKNILLLLMCGIIYFSVYFYKYSLQIVNIPIAIDQILIMFFLMLCIVDHTIINVNNGSIIKKTYYEWMFNFIVTIMAIPMLYLLLKNKLTLNPYESLFHVKDIFNLIEFFTTTDREFYIKHYLDYFLVNKHLTLVEYKHIFRETLFEVYFNSNITMDEIKEIIIDLIKRKDVVLQEDETIINKIKRWLGY